jgi:hypothetical protein
MQHADIGRRDRDGIRGLEEWGSATKHLA